MTESGPPAQPSRALAADATRPLALLQELCAAHGDAFAYDTPYGRLHLFNRPADVRQVLHTDALVRTNLVKLVLGEGLLASDGAFWKQQRKLQQPAFDRRFHARWAEHVLETTERTVRRWDEPLASATPVDVGAAMNRLTLEVGVRFLFSVVLPDDEARAVTDAVSIFMSDLGEVGCTLFGAPLLIRPETRGRLERALAVVDAFAGRIVEERRRAVHPPRDLLSLLLEARPPSVAQPLDERQLRDEIVTMLISAHETTALSLTWAWHCLAAHPTAEERLHEELDHVLGGRPPAFEDLERLVWTRKVLDESLRLYPPVWFIARTASTDGIVIGAHPVPRGETVVVSPWLLHRDPALWERPEAFDPERFAAQAVRERHRYAYLPFGGGRHLCLGKTLAEIEGVLGLASMAQRLVVRPVPGQPVAPQPGLTLRLQQGLLAHLRERRPQAPERAA